MDKKLTDNEIKSALKGAILNAKGYDSKVWSIEVYKLENALDLINRLQSKNEEYQKSLEKILVEVQEAKELYVKDIANAKSEAYKELAERLKSHLHQDDFETPDERWKPESEFANLIDNLLKELVGDNNDL